MELDPGISNCRPTHLVYVLPNSSSAQYSAIRDKQRKKVKNLFTANVSGTFCFSELCHRPFKGGTGELAVAMEMGIIRKSVSFLFSIPGPQFPVKSSAGYLYCPCHLLTGSHVLSHNLFGCDSIQGFGFLLS